VALAASVTAVDETGGEARAYMIDDDVVLKTQRPQQLRASTSLEKEVAFLNALADDPGVNVPRVLGYGRDGDVEYTVMTRMPGVASRTVEIEGQSRIDLLRSLGRMLRRLHSLPQQQFYDSPLFPGVRTTAAFEERLRAALERAVDLIERDPGIWRLAISPRALADRVLGTSRSDVDLVALHSNPGPEHVFINPGSLGLTGIIDFGDAYIAHHALDMRWPRPEDRETVLAGYSEEQPLSEAFLAAWRATLIFGDMTAIATRPARREVATRTLEALVAEV
jgi:hygromycin-B 7''-O-kinase